MILILKYRERRVNIFEESLNEGDDYNDYGY